MTTINRQVSANNDDAHEAQDGSSFNRGGFQVNGNSNSAVASRYIMGHRFTNVTVPKGAAILTAVIRIVCITDVADDPNVDIHAEDDDNAEDFLAAANVWGRSRTTASVAWTAVGIGSGSYVTSPEIKTVIQEVVNRPGWASGNALTILVKGKSDVNRTFNVEAHDASPSLTAKLDITYSVDKGRSYARAIL